VHRISGSETCLSAPSQQSAKSKTIPHIHTEVEVIDVDSIEGNMAVTKGPRATQAFTTSDFLQGG